MTTFICVLMLFLTSHESWKVLRTYLNIIIMLHLKDTHGWMHISCCWPFLFFFLFGNDFKQCLLYNPLFQNCIAPLVLFLFQFTREGLLRFWLWQCVHYYTPGGPYLVKCWKEQRKERNELMWHIDEIIDSTFEQNKAKSIQRSYGSLKLRRLSNICKIKKLRFRAEEMVQRLKALKRGLRG